MLTKFLSIKKCLKPDINYTDIISINLKIKSDKVTEFEELIKEFKL